MKVPVANGGDAEDDGIGEAPGRPVSMLLGVVPGTGFARSCALLGVVNSRKANTVQLAILDTDTGLLNCEHHTIENCRLVTHLAETRLDSLAAARRAFRLSASAITSRCARRALLVLLEA